LLYINNAYVIADFRGFLIS